MSYTLCVIDMQATFAAANDRFVRKHCKQEIIKAMDSRASIIFVEYIGQGPTIPSLVKLTDDYDRTFIVRKNNDDGSQEVSKTIKDNRLSSRKIKVCGVNTDCCVAATVYGLHAKLRPPKMEVIGNACNSTYDHSYGLLDMSKICKVNKE